MSIERIYQRGFIKANNKYVPLVLIGNSSLTETEYDRYGRPHEVVVKEWATISPSNIKILFTEKELLQAVQKHVEETKLKYKGKYLTNVSYQGKLWNEKSVMNFYKNGMKKAITVEEFISEIGDCLDLRCHTKTDHYTVCVQSTQDLIEEVEKALTQDDLIHLSLEARDNGERLIKNH